MIFCLVEFDTKSLKIIFILNIEFVPIMFPAKELFGKEYSL